MLFVSHSGPDMFLWVLGLGSGTCSEFVGVDFFCM